MNGTDKGILKVEKVMEGRLCYHIGELELVGMEWGK